MEYHITWEIDLDASSPVEAAKEALKTQREAGSEAVVFNVTDGKGKQTLVDLMEEE